MSKVKLQVALDFLELPRALKVAEMAVKGGADYLEAGTPLIKSEGLNSVRTLRKMFPKHIIIADMKTMDAGRIEAESASKAGANVMTVSGTASFSTIKECVEAGKHYGIEVAVDLLGVKDVNDFIKKTNDFGISWLDVHCPIDAQMLGKDPLSVLKEIRPLTNLVIAAAGGLNSETAPIAAEAGANVIIVGGAITKAINPEEATKNIRKAIDTLKPVSTENFKRTSIENV